jgi:hypothetical protein
VPAHYGKRELHPVVLLKTTPVETLAGSSPLAAMKPVRNVEFARFGKKWVVVNHRSTPVDIRAMETKRIITQLPSADGWLAAHSAACLEMA